MARKICNTDKGFRRMPSHFTNRLNIAKGINYQRVLYQRQKTQYIARKQRERRVRLMERGELGSGESQDSQSDLFPKCEGIEAPHIIQPDKSLSESQTVTDISLLTKETRKKFKSWEYRKIAQENFMQKLVHKPYEVRRQEQEEYKRQFMTQEEIAQMEAGPENPLEDFEQFKQSIGDKWFPHLQSAIEGEQFEELYWFLKKEYEETTCFPAPHRIFRPFHMSGLQDIKVVIMGQDPQPNLANGLSFSVDNGRRSPASLLNIYEALSNDPKIKFQFTPKLFQEGDLTPWAEQGVFLLNKILTVRKNESLSHAKQGWEKFTRQAIISINENTENVVFMFWGSMAQMMGTLVDHKRHFVINECHPSPMAGHTFKMTRCFSQCNQYLYENGRKPINWDVSCNKNRFL